MVSSLSQLMGEDAAKLRTPMAVVGGSSFLEPATQG